VTQIELAPELQTGDLPPGTGSVFRNRGFVFLWSAQLLSQLAGNMVLAALMSTIVSVTGSNTLVAVLILTFLAPAVLFSALAGVFVERSDARLIMLAANALRAVGTAAFILVGTHIGAIFALNLAISTVTAFFNPAELTAIPRIVAKNHLMAANSIFVLTVNAAFAVGFGFLGPLILTTTSANVVFGVVAVMFALAAVAIIPLPAVRPMVAPPKLNAGKALTEVFAQLSEGVAFVRGTPKIAWSLTYQGVAASLIGVLGALGPGFAVYVLGLSAEDFFFIMGPAGLGAIGGILFLNSFGKVFPRRLIIDIGLLSMGVTLVLVALVRPMVNFFGPSVQPLEENLPAALAPGGVSVFARFAFVVALADLLLDLFRRFINRGIEITIPVLCVQIRPSHAQPE
jgi:Na+/melibiose symporter-like transporter